MKQLMKQRYQEMHGETGDGGFTLIELLVVIVILAILAAVVVFAVGGITDKGTTSSCKSDTKTLQTAEEAFFANNNTSLYTTEDGLVPQYLASTSPLHNITLATDKKSYTVTQDSSGKCNGVSES